MNQTHALTAATAMAVLTLCGGTAGAQSFPGGLHDHAYWQRPVHQPSLVKLSAHCRELATIARHLRLDAHSLSQDYVGSAEIRASVDCLDRLKTHMDELLQQAAGTGTISPGLVRHIRGDLREVKSLFYQLYGQLQHQAIGGVRPCDSKLISHMQQIIVDDAFPLVRLMETCLSGQVPAVDPHRVLRPTWPTPIPSATIRAPFGRSITIGRGFRISF